jgi:hypothetical protein
MSESNNNKPLYPIHKKDKLGRITHSQWNEFERSVKKYWKDTNNLKVLYKFYRSDVSFDVYDLDGNVIMSYRSGDFNINFKLIKISADNKLYFKVKRDVLWKWRKLMAKPD